jgi:hypothetical protein
MDHGFFAFRSADVHVVIAWNRYRPTADDARVRVAGVYNPHSRLREQIFKGLRFVVRLRADAVL